MRIKIKNQIFDGAASTCHQKSKLQTPYISFITLCSLNMIEKFPKSLVFQGFLEIFRFSPHDTQKAIALQ
jgi:hypothetical protein